jgi:hypothetical protein
MPGLVGLVGPDAGQQPAMLDQLAVQIPMGQVGDPDEIAKAAVFQGFRWFKLRQLPRHEGERIFLAPRTATCPLL